jgi:uncharacterized protein (DUF1800 family)
MPVLRLAILLTFSVPLGAQAPSRDEVARATHVLNRLAFGPRPGEAERVARTGVDRWIDEQLRARPALDSAGTAALAGCPIWLSTAPPSVASMTTRITETMTVATSAAGTPTLPSARSRTLILVGMIPPILRDSARKSGGVAATYIASGRFLACRVARAERSDQQLVEVMTDFWGNHFSLYVGRVLGAASYVEWDRDVIRARSLGRFRDLLGAVVRHPAMLSYLDNALNTADALNENYARELLELHTLGVDGGYTQADVIDVARALTGWTHTAGSQLFAPAAADGAALTFAFKAEQHDRKLKTILGLTLPAGRGIEDGDDVLDILARHPSTARHIARKLAVRFVGDNPPPALIERAAATYLRTDGDIREVVRTVVTSPEFFAAESRHAKIKSPLEFVLSARRALAAPRDTAAETVDLLLMLDQVPLAHPSPEGWPETSTKWLGTGALLSRVRIATGIANDEFPSIPVNRWPEWSRLAAAPFDIQVEGVIESVLGGRASETTRSAMLAARPPAADSARPAALRELLGLALSSPEFQRR